MTYETKHVRIFREKHLNPGEQIVHVADGFIGRMMGSGRDKQHNGTVIVTTQRVAFYRKRLLAGEILQTIPITGVTSIERISGVLFSTLTVHTSHDSLIVTLLTKVDAGINAAIEQVRDWLKAQYAPPPAHAPQRHDPTAALAQLNILRSQGLISQAEFDAKRSDILARI